MMAEHYEKIPSLRKPGDIFNLQGRTGVIIGGAGGMGVEFAETFLEAGATVVMADRDADRMQTALVRLRKGEPGDRIIGKSCDVSRVDQIESLFSFVRSDLHRLDFLVYNVMAKPEGYYRTSECYELETWNKVIEGNLTGAFLSCRRAAGLMDEGRGGAIVLTASVYGVVGPDQRIYEGGTSTGNIYGGEDALNCPAVYSASKAGLVGLARYFSTLWGRQGIRVNALVPGGVFDGQESAFHEAYVRRTPLGRMAVWSDFNGAALFLVSDASRYMTGSQLIVDGGWTAW